MTEMAISPLRRRMIEDMTVRKFVEKTQNDYIRNVKNLVAFLGRSPDTATAEDLRRYQLHLTEAGVRPPTINSAVSALRFFFSVTVGRPAVTKPLTFVAEPRKIPVVEPRRGGALPGGGTWAKVQGCLECGLRGGPARVRGRRAQGQRRRFPAHAAQDRAGQGTPGPLCDALAAAARALAGLVAHRPPSSLALSRTEPGQPSRPASVQSGRPCRRPRGRDHQAGHAAHAAPQLRTHLLEQNIDIRVIQVLLGHAKLDTTALYTRVATNTIRTVMSPLDRLTPLRMKPAEPPA